MGKKNIVSVINMKGGVGKTTLSIGVADYLSNFRSDGKKILLIDIDPQFNATQALLEKYYLGDYFTDILSTQKTIYRLFIPQVQFSTAPQIPTENELILQLTDNLDIICGDLNLVLANKNSDYALVKKLKRFIKDNCLKEKYDLIIIDCPPTLTLYTDSALMASDFYLIPNRIDRYSMVGISSLQQAISNLVREEEIDLSCLGLVYTRVGNVLTAKEEEMKMNFEEKNEVKSLYKFTATTTYVRDIEVGKLGCIPTCYVKSRNDIRDLSAEILDRIKTKNGEKND